MFSMDELNPSIYAFTFVFTRRGKQIIIIITGEADTAFSKLC